jgi:thiosulfate/3-mercaptopyruvate sulfurtransferase
MEFRTLNETEHLAARLHDPQLAIVDCRFDLKDLGAGERAYHAGHVPGALYAHLDRDLSGPKTGDNGRHPLPDPQRFARTLAALGVGADTQVVAYDQDSGIYASRFWWMVRWLGHDAVAVLNGGFAKWLADARPVSTTTERRAAQRFVAHLRPEMLVSTADLSARRNNAWRLVDARAPERFRGDVEPLDKAAGHIPGAVNHHFQTNLNAQGTLRSRSELAAHFHDTMHGTTPESVVCYCGSGVTACQNLLALEHAGLRGAKLYAGSWSEWSADPERPIATGDEPSRRP